MYYIITTSAIVSMLSVLPPQQLQGPDHNKICLPLLPRLAPNRLS